MKADKLVEGLLENRDPISDRRREDLMRIGTYLPLVCWMSSPEAPAYWFNPEWYDFTGRTEKTMQNWAYQDFHHADYIGAAVKKRYETFAAGEVWEDIFPLLGHDDKFHWLLSRGVPLKNEQGIVTDYFCFHMDVTNKIIHPHLSVSDHKKKRRA